MMHRRFRITVSAIVFMTTAAGLCLAQTSESPAPVRLDADKMAGLNLTSIPPDA